MKKRNFVSGLIIFIIIMVASAGAVTWTLVSNHRKSDSDSSLYIERTDKHNEKSDSSKKSKNKDYIAKLTISGTIEDANATYNQEWILDTISTLTDDEKNRAMIIYINSPGGGVYQSDDVYLALQDYRSRGKKIYVYMGPMAASGGYYISCAANKIYANRNTLTGSIGVISGQIFDLTELFDKLGIKSETIHAGKNKNMGNYNEPFTDEQRQILQSVADECYEQFTSIVATQRHLPLSKVQELADGRVYTAKQALQLGLIDCIDTYEHCVEDLKNNELEDPDIRIVYYEYEHKQNFMNLMMGKVENLENSQAAAKLGIPQKVMEQINNPVPYPAFIYQN